MVLKTAVVGGGTVSTRHLTGLERNPRVDLVAICDIDRDRAQTLATRYGIKAYFDMDEMLREESLDWVHICTSVQTHRDLSIKAIEAGCDVLIEKPVTLTVEEVEDIERAAAEHGVIVSVVRNHLFSYKVREVLERIEAGELGKLRAVEVVYTGNTPPDQSNRGAWTFELPGGEFEEGIPHPIYVALGLGGHPASTEDAFATTSLSRSYAQGFTYDGLQLGWTTADEVLCAVTVTAGGVSQRVVNIHGEKASLLLDLISQTVIKLDKDYDASPVSRGRNNIDHIAGRAMGTLSNLYGMAKRRFEDDWEDELYWDAHWSQFNLEAEALLNRTQPPIPLEQAVWTMRLVELVREQAERRDAGKTDSGQRLAGGPDPTVR
jgi:predicted dehydrogenase